MIVFLLGSAWCFIHGRGGGSWWHAALGGAAVGVVAFSLHLATHTHRYLGRGLTSDVVVGLGLALITNCAAFCLFYSIAFFAGRWSMRWRS